MGTLAFQGFPHIKQMRHRGFEPDYYSKKLEKKGLAAHHSFSVIKSVIKMK